MSYQKSPEHIANFNNARKISADKNREGRLERIRIYNLDPKLCEYCSGPIDYDKQVNKFCSSSCSCSFNNKLKIRDKETNQKISNSLIKRSVLMKEQGIKNVRNNRYVYTKDNPKPKKFLVCKICNVTFECSDKQYYGRIKTCSTECKITAVFSSRTYQNGSKKFTPYINPSDGETVLLESSWEVAIADVLGDKNITWNRPKPIPWVDSENKKHLYYPDFYLPDYDLYLDPKNPYGMKIGAEKMLAVSKIVNIRYGNIEYLTNIINKL